MRLSDLQARAQLALAQESAVERELRQSLMMDDYYNSSIAVAVRHIEQYERHMDIVRQVERVLGGARQVKWYQDLIENPLVQAHWALLAKRRKNREMSDIPKLQRREISRGASAKIGAAQVRQMKRTAYPFGSRPSLRHRGRSMTRKDDKDDILPGTLTGFESAYYLN